MPYSTVEQYPKMEGRQLIMVLAPKKVGGEGRRESGQAGGEEGGCAGEACTRQGRGGSRRRHRKEVVVRVLEVLHARRHPALR